ncbi:MAG: hypothetical protein ACPGQD_06465, partial [Planctomycetota bacterium]
LLTGLSLRSQLSFQSGLLPGFGRCLLTLLARQGRLLHGPAVDLPAESTLTASFGGNSIVLQARRWTPQDRRRFLEGSQTSSDE